jgi:hypothetical protein
MTRFSSVTSMPRDARVAWIAAHQHGVVGYAQLREAELSPAAVDHRVAAGWLHRKHKGVFAVGHPGLTKRGRWMAAVLAGGDQAVLSHRSAGALWGLCPEGPRTEVTLPGKRHDQHGIHVHAGAIRPGDTMLVDGIRVTKVARTLLDLAETLTLTQLVEAIDQATARGHLRPKLISSMIKMSRGRRGLKTLKEALLITRPQDILTRSELERRALKLFAKANLPKPEVNARLHGKERDVLWREQRLVVELDGRDHDARREADYRRDAELLARGYTTLRFTWRQIINDPTWVVEVLSGCAPTAAATPSASAARRADQSSR